MKGSDFFGERANNSTEKDIYDKQNGINFAYSMKIKLVLSLLQEESFTFAADLIKQYICCVMEGKQPQERSKKQKTVRFFVIVFICHIIGFALIWLVQHFIN